MTYREMCELISWFYTGSTKEATKLCGFNPEEKVIHVFYLHDIVEQALSRLGFPPRS